jgi:hypothetical protein
LFTHDSVCTYDELINELYEIDGKRKRQWYIQILTIFIQIYVIKQL